jgi:hypothetical protein
VEPGVTPTPVRLFTVKLRLMCVRPVPSVTLLSVVVISPENLIHSPAHAVTWAIALKHEVVCVVAVVALAEDSIACVLIERPWGLSVSGDTVSFPQPPHIINMPAATTRYISRAGLVIVFIIYRFKIKK